MEQSVESENTCKCCNSELKFLKLLTACAGDFGRVPLAVGPAAYSGGVSLNEALFTVITEQGIDLVARLHGPKHTSILHHRGLPA